jgi:hypothetical protein
MRVIVAHDRARHPEQALVVAPHQDLEERRLSRRHAARELLVARTLERQRRIGLRHLPQSHRVIFSSRSESRAAERFQAFSWSRPPVSGLHLGGGICP